MSQVTAPYRATNSGQQKTPDGLVKMANMDKETYLLTGWDEKNDKNHPMRAIVGRHAAIAAAKKQQNVQKFIDNKTLQLLEGLPVKVGDIQEWRSDNGQTQIQRILGPNDPEV